MLFGSTPAARACAPTKATSNLVLWDFHDLLFHTHSTEGRQANPLGRTLPLCRYHAAAAGGAGELARQGIDLQQHLAAAFECRLRTR